MGRKRKDENAWLPPGVYEDNGRYVYRKGKTCARLCSVDSPRSLVWIAYEKYTANDDQTFKSLAMEYFDSPKFKALSPRTQKDYHRYYGSVRGYETKYGEFADVRVELFTPGMITLYLENRGAPIQANREMAFVSAVFAWGVARDKAPHNPCIGVQRNTERPRKRYVSDLEYNAVYEYAATRIPGKRPRPWYLQPMMEFAYLCRMRMVEVLDLKKSDILEQGLDTRRVKGSNDAVTLWSDRLRKAVNQCLEQKGQVESIYLFHNGRGGKVTQSSVQSAWQRMMRDVSVDRFTYHDLKAKGVSDFDGDKKKASGHKSASMVAIYDRKKDEVDATR